MNFLACNRWQGVIYMEVSKGTEPCDNLKQTNQYKLL